ncbi:hypothetical protein ACQR7C_26880 (plasmid) [Salmonella enterica]
MNSDKNFSAGKPAKNFFLRPLRVAIAVSSSALAAKELTESNCLER